ncbi:MAG: hypothetical protein ABSB58_11445 [Gemmatimonadales bacterium]|jgi:hypothetical protein
MHARHVIPFLLLFAWQSAPSPDPRDRPTRLRVWLGGGQRSFDLSYYGTAGGECLDPGGDNTCNCSRFAPTYTKRYDDADKVSVTGVQVEAWPSPTLRISAATGSAEGAYLGSGHFTAALAGWESPFVGLGAGLSDAPEHLAYRGLAAYLRVGPVDRAHFRADLRTPTSTPGVTGWARVGLGYNLGQGSGSSVFLGVSAVEAGPDTTYDNRPGTPVTMTRPALFLDATAALGRTFEVFLRGHVAKHSNGAAVGVAARLLR